ncbi:MAG: hypothetical protein HYV97_01985 [Bdellovibrio sp.]|nr:hypothetical protein [Bdellovibrio sp.]
MPILRASFIMALLISTWAWAAEGPTPLARSYVQKIKNSSHALVEFNNAVDSSQQDTIYLFVQGIEIGNGEQWAAAFDVAIRRKASFYFHKIYNRKSLKRNVSLIKKSIREVQRRHPNQKIEILAYSAGGAATLVAWRDLESKRSNYHDIHLTTIASPLSGYGAPIIAVPFVSLFFGAYNGKLARGVADELRGQQLSLCRHFVNMDCRLDRHSCPRRGTSNTQLLPEMPCGTDNITEFYNETHESIIARAAEMLVQ